MPSVDLSLGPLTVTTQAVNVALALSVEFPTAGAAYRSSTNTYDHTQEYLGYWDPNSCYAYFDAADTSMLDGQYFKRTGAVDSNKYCNTSGAGNGYSGNVLNFAATSSIDLLRFALTGGNRVLDTADKTILGRAYLPSNFGFPDGTYFPSKQVAATLVGKVTPTFANPSGSGNFAGNVFFTNCNDLLHVGNTSSGGSCTSATSATNNLGPTVADLSGTPTIQYFASAPTNTSTATYVIDPLGRKQWGKTGGTTTTLPSGSDATAGTLVPEVATYTKVKTGTASTPQSTGDPVTGYTHTVVSGTNPWAPVSPNPSFPIPSADTASLGFSWVAAGTSGNADYEGIAAELNDDNRGDPANQVASNSKKIETCYNKSSKVEKKVRKNTSFGTASNTCPSGFTDKHSVNQKTYRLFKKVNTYKVVSSTPIYDTYDLTPASWFVYVLETAYEVYGVKKTIMKAFVQVCDATEGPTRTDADGVRVCKRYPNDTASTGVYKPVGELQNKAEGVRVSAFGYALENGNGRYGGVLRAPMKFVGPQYRDTAGFMQSNTQTEWDAITGVFVTDPLNAAGGSSAFPSGAPAFTTSGVVNYLNKFGRSGTYKSNDPVGELYYETLRYFQGKQPTAAATSSLATAAYDGFPIYSTWTDPIQNGCQRRNFTLAIGDVNTHYDKQLPGHKSSIGVNETTIDPARAAESIPGSASTWNTVDWTKLLTGFETGTSMAYTDALGRAQNTLGNPNVVSGNTSLDTKATGSSSSAYYWAGAAYWANTQPIRYDSMVVSGKTQTLSNIRVKTFTIDVDEGGNGSIDANTRSIKPRNSSFFLAGKYGWFNDANDDGNPFKTSGGVTSNKEWEDATLPTVPDGYTLASQAKRMIAGIRKFFAAASAQSGAVSVSSISSQRFTTSSPNGDLYAPRFDSRDWSGTVIKSTLALNTVTQTIDAVADVVWDSGLILTTGTGMATTTTSVDPYQKPSERKIFTYRREGAGGAIAFTSDNLASFDAVMRTALNTNPATSASDGLGALRVDYLRGVRTQEGAATNRMRTRGSIQGDIINSGPVYKKEADTDIAADSAYASFANTMTGRTATVYVGANDGMLHAFRASDGKELFAYVPLAVAANLNKLTNPNYQHTVYVDGVPQVGEAKLGSSWRTVLVSGMGGGAQGVFALDVTNPENFESGETGAGKVLFEFTDQDDPTMGNVLMQPKLVKLKIPPTTVGGLPSYKWFVAVGSGYNNYVNDGTGRYSLTGDQALFLLSLDKPAAEVWSEGSNYFKIVVPAASTSIANGMANPGFTMGSNGEATLMYAGDLQGNIWKFDFYTGLSSTNISDNKITKAVSGVRKPLFTATDSSSNRQPITISPLIATAQKRGLMVIFGTGKFMEQIDAASTGTQGIYGVWDSGGTATSDYSLDKTKLQQQTATEGTSTVTIATTAFTFGTGTGEKRGWYFNFPNSRERVAVEGAQGLTSVAIPSTIPAGDCTGDGDGRNYVINGLTGGAAGTIQASSSIGLISRPTYVSLELDDAGSYTARRADGTRKYTVDQAVISTGTQITSAGNVGAQTSKATTQQITTGRISWREIRNFKE
jgi:type IV pilus assembly protein PilY1